MQIRDFQEGSGVVTISLGVSREFFLMRDNDRHKVHITLAPGSLFFLGWQTNMEWKHSVPKDGNIQGIRLGLTYRSIVTHYAPENNDSVDVNNVNEAIVLTAIEDSEI